MNSYLEEASIVGNQAIIGFDKRQVILCELALAKRYAPFFFSWCDAQNKPDLKKSYNEQCQTIVDNLLNPGHQQKNLAVLKKYRLELELAADSLGEDKENAYVCQALLNLVIATNASLGSHFEAQWVICSVASIFQATEDIVEFRESAKALSEDEMNALKEAELNKEFQVILKIVDMLNRKLKRGADVKKPLPKKVVDEIFAIATEDCRA